MVKLLTVLFLSLTLAGCSGNKLTSSRQIEDQVDRAEVITTKRFNELQNLPPVD
jgi:hypothetical protein